MAKLYNMYYAFNTYPAVSQVVNVTLRDNNCHVADSNLYILIEQRKVHSKVIYREVNCHLVSLSNLNSYFKHQR